MISLQRRLTWLLATGLTILLLLALAMAYPAARRWLITEFDAAMLAKARTLTTLPEAEREGINLVFAERGLPEYQRTNAPEYFQVWLGDGAVFARSPSLGTASLPLRSGHWDLKLPDGRPGRAVGVAYSLTPGASTDFTLVLARDTLPLRRSLQTLVLGLIAGGVMLVAVTAWLVGRVTGVGLRPIESLAREVTSIDATKLSKRFNAQSAPRELRGIVEQLNQLMARLEAAFAREQRFTASAAHELLTPVSELRVLAEAAAKWRHDPEATAQFADDVKETAVQMEQIIRALLALGRPGSAEASTTDELIPVSDLVRELWPGIAERAQFKRISLECKISDGLVARGGSALARAVFTNLLDNAIEHCPLDGRICCTLESANAFTLTISNTNPELTPADLPHLAEPFWRKDPARSDRAHAGLGLALVAVFAERLGWMLHTELEGGLVRVTVCGRRNLPVS